MPDQFLHTRVVRKLKLAILKIPQAFMKPYDCSSLVYTFKTGSNSGAFATYFYK